MENPEDLIDCPDCNGTGCKIIFDWNNLEEHQSKEECTQCSGTGYISEMDWGYFKKDKKDSINEDLKD